MWAYKRLYEQPNRVVEEEHCFLSLPAYIWKAATPSAGNNSKYVHFDEDTIKDGC